jgi:hypothetical protein
MNNHTKAQQFINDLSPDTRGRPKHSNNNKAGTGSNTRPAAND